MGDGGKRHPLGGGVQKAWTLKNSIMVRFSIELFFFKKNVDLQ